MSVCPARGQGRSRREGCIMAYLCPCRPLCVVSGGGRNGRMEGWEGEDSHGGHIITLTFACFPIVSFSISFFSFFFFYVDDDLVTFWLLFHFFFLNGCLFSVCCLLLLRNLLFVLSFHFLSFLFFFLISVFSFIIFHESFTIMFSSRHFSSN